MVHTCADVALEAGARACVDSGTRDTDLMAELQDLDPELLALLDEAPGGLAATGACAWPEVATAWPPAPGTSRARTHDQARAKRARIDAAAEGASTSPSRLRERNRHAVSAPSRVSTMTPISAAFLQ